MITIDRSYDVDLIDYIIRNPSIYASMSDDSCPSDPSRVTVESVIDTCLFLLVKIDAVVSGCFMLEPNDKSYTAHTALLPNCRGRRAISAGRAMLKWVFGNTECREVTSYAFSDSPHVDWFARAVGLRVTGVADYPNTRNGKHVSVTNFSILKDQFIE
jgi:hypothetical protein